MSELFKICFVCGSLVDETKFDATKRDGKNLCSEQCLDDYLDMDDYEFEICTKKYKENLS